MVEGEKFYIEPLQNLSDSLEVIHKTRFLYF